MIFIKSANLLLAFLMELVALGVLAYYGYRTGQGTVFKICLSIGYPLILAVVWGAFLSPKASFEPPIEIKMLLQFIVFSIIAYLLYLLRHTTLAYTFLSVVVVNFVLIIIWKQ